MDELDVFREIKKTAQKHYFLNDKSDNLNHFEKGINYLTECQNILHTYFNTNEYLSEKHLYSTLSYIDQREDTKTQTALIKNSSFPLGYYWSNKLLNEEQIIEARTFFEDFMEDINSKKLISLTNILFDRSRFKAPDFIISNCQYTEEEIYQLSSNETYLNQQICHFAYDDSTIDFNQYYEYSIGSFLEVYNQNKSKSPNSNNIDKVKEYFKRYQRAIELFREMGFDCLHFNFIKPFLEGNDYNVLLTVATTNSISRSERSLINLFLYKIISYMATDLQTLKAENAELRRSKSFSLVTHHLKTHLSTTVRNYINRVLDNLKSKKFYNDSKLQEASYLLYNEIEDLYALSGVYTLVDKLPMGVKKFHNSGLKDKLLTKEKYVLDFQSIADEFNSLNTPNKSYINVIYKDELTSLKEPILKYGCDAESRVIFGGKILLASFYRTILENASFWGKNFKRGKTTTVDLTVSMSSDNWLIFSNETNDSSISVKVEDFENSNINRLTGNLHFFKDTLNGIHKEERMKIESPQGSYKYTVKILMT